MKTREIPFEVNCKDVVKTHHVRVKNTINGKEYTAPAKEWHWRNSFYADITFVFRGQEFTVCAEVNAVYSDGLY